MALQPYTTIINANPGDPQANSYVDYPTALTILTVNRAYCPEWKEAVANGPTPTTDAMLIWATSFLDKMVEWNGYKATRLQALRWPRSGCYDRDGFYVDKSIVPQHIMDITAQLAWEFLKKYRMVEPFSLGLGIDGHLKVGAVDINLQPKNFVPFIPLYLKAEISYWGLLNGIGEGGMMTTRLIRG